MVLRLYVQECVTVDLFKSICTFMTTYPSTPSESSEEVFKFNLNSRVHLSVLTLSSTLAGGLNGAVSTCVSYAKCRQALNIIMQTPLT